MEKTADFTRIFKASFAGFCVFCEFHGILWIYLKFAAPRPREKSEALYMSNLVNGLAD